MQLAVVQRILGLLLMGFSLSMLPPMAVSHWYGDGQIRYFFIPLLTMIGLGLLIWYPVRRCALELRTHHGFIIVTLFWSVLGVVSALPFYLAPHPHLSFTDAVFEAVSGFTTTGATVISGLDALPKSMLYYRAQLHFLGGMGIVVLAVAIMPMLGVGGMTLYRAETPGPMKDEKLTPRITHTARALWLVYVGLNVACALAYWGAGMSPFDAVTHAFGTIATGGFSNYDASFAQFQSPLLEVIATVFMFLGGVNFAVHFLAFGDRSFKPYCHDIETRAFLWICLGLSVLVALLLLWEGVYGDPLSALRYAAFQVVSIITTTGFTSAGFAEWPSFLPILLIYISFIGGCA
ncbi:MAG TPA: potassium transporter TrkG, partial [Candidatus Competibacteraceae bacterium]|nr:potassium transporter TrkG [Candidatus Competibacteraceae bacterium]